MPEENVAKNSSDELVSRETDSPVVIESNSVEGRINISNSSDATINPPPPIEELIPEEFKGKAYLADVKDIPGLFKKLDGAQQLIGKKTIGIPDEKATEEDWTKFYESIGRPKEASEYGLEADESNKEFVGEVSKLLFDVGLSKSQAEKLNKGYTDLISKYSDLNGKSQEEQDKEFDSLANEVFGDKKTQALDTAKKLLEENAPDKFRDHINKLSNENLIVLASVLNGVKNRYIAEDNLSGLHKNSTSTESTQDLRDRAVKLMASEAYSSRLHPRHDEVFSEVQELYQRIGKMS